MPTIFEKRKAGRPPLGDKARTIPMTINVTPEMEDRINRAAAIEGVKPAVFNLGAIEKLLREVEMIGAGGCCVSVDNGD